MPGGRPTKYNPELHLILVEAMAEMGLTQEQIAERLKISSRTLARWMADDEEFCQAVKRGSVIADEKVVRSLYQRATGYEHKAVKIFMPSGAKQPVYAEFIEHVPPDVTAQIYWTKNRDRAKWGDRTQHEVTGKDGSPIEFTQIQRVIVDPKP